jgi:hypothetical protein
MKICYCLVPLVARSVHAAAPHQTGVSGFFWIRFVDGWPAGLAGYLTISEPTPAPALPSLLHPFTRFPLLLRGLPSFLRCRVDAAAGVGPLRGMSAMPRLRIDGAGMQRFDARIILRVLDCDDDLVFPSRRSQTTGFDRGVN